MVLLVDSPEDLNNNGENDLFGMELYYDKTIDGMHHQTYEDGKISAMRWNSSNLNEIQTYTFNYDDLNRLTAANYSPQQKYNVWLSYDLNGNILSLKRAGEIEQKSRSPIGEPPVPGPPLYSLIDDLTYTYNGNQLTSVADAVGDINTQLNNDFRDYNAKGMQEYFYDANGNMLSETFAYTYDGQLINAYHMTYAYDVNNNLIDKKRS